METWSGERRKGNLWISKFDILWTLIKNRKSYRSRLKILMMLSCTLRRAIASDIKTTSMSIVGWVFCEFSRRRVLVVRSWDWYGGKWVSSLWPILSRSSRGTPCFVSTLKYESPGVRRVVRQRNRNTRTRHGAIDTLRAAVKFNVSLVMSITVFFSEII